MEHIIPWDFSIIPLKFHLFTQAAGYTLFISFFGILAGIVSGLCISLMKISKNKVFSGIAGAYIFIIRGTPLLLQLFIIYYGLTTLVAVPPLLSAILALGFHNGAYIAEIFRGSIQSIHYGQMEAALSLGMSKSRTMIRIILPQAFKRAVPPLGNQFIIALKDSSLASTIAVPELLLRGRQLGASSFMYMEMLVITAIWYLLMTGFFSYVIHRTERKLKISDRNGN
jgi:polar amino acid transport system permease protein